MTFILLTLCLIAGVGEVLSCSCFPMTEEQKYCEADYLLKVKVTSEFKNPNRQQDFDDFFRIRVLKEYKGPHGVSLKDQFQVFTGTNSALCGVRLQKGKNYLIAGNWKRGRLTLNMCSSIYAQYPLHRQMKRMLRRRPNCSLLPQHNDLLSYN